MAYSFVPITVTDAATYTCAAKDSGTLHIIPDLTQDIVITMPAAAAGLSYKFVYGGVTTDTSDWAFDFLSNTNFLLDGVLWQIGSGAAEFFGPDGNSNSKWSIVVPEPGTWVEFVCDGTNWIVSGLVVAATTPAATDQ